jgi:predicted nucleic acid-binding protein
MRVLLDTNVIIHREANYVVKDMIGSLFYWLDKLKHEKYIHPSSIDEIRQHKDPKVVATFEKKLQSYNVLKTLAPDSSVMVAIRQKYDTTPNDIIDSSLLNELYSERVDILITEDKKIHTKANALGLSDKVFKIDAFLEKAVAENPDLVDYDVLSVRQEYFGNIDIQDPFFDSFKRDYPGFEKWFNRKAQEIAYICKGEDNSILAFLYIKTESKDENYNDIQPVLEPKYRLKIGTFKVTINGFKLGERFLKIVFDNALQYRVDEIYVTIFDRTIDQKRLIELLQEWGFLFHGKKGEENVYTRNFRPGFNLSNPQLTYPYFSRTTRKFIVPIYPEYHTELFPDSILRTESSKDFIENRPNRNALSKVYISRSYERSLKRGDMIVFYRTKTADGSAYYTSVTTTVGIVQEVITKIDNLKHFISLCKRRSVFTDADLAKHWNYAPNNRPFIVNFLYIFSFAKRLNLKILQEQNIISDAPRGFELLNDHAFQTLMELSNGDQRLIVD